MNPVSFLHPEPSPAPRGAEGRAPMYDPRLSRLVTAGVERLVLRVQALLPRSFALVVGWMRGIAPGGAPERYFQHPNAFPTLLLPFWLEGALAGEVNEEIQGELVYSSMCGYYFIRLVDDCMDLGAGAHLLPALGVLHAEFQGVHQRLFPADDALWPELASIWGRTADAAMADARAATLTLEDFEAVSAGKVAAARIPMLAICRLHGLAALPEGWERLFVALSRFHQMHNDFFDWHRDLANGAVTYFLSEAERRRRRDEPVASWMVREGFRTGMATLRRLLEEALDTGPARTSPEVRAYCEARGEALSRAEKDVSAGLAALAAVSALAEAA